MGKKVTYYCDKCKKGIFTAPHEFHVTHHTEMSLDNRWYLCETCFRKWFWFLANKDYKEDEDRDAK